VALTLNDVCLLKM